MRKIIVLSFITLDGVMQAPGGPDEDTEGNYRYGGWTATYFDKQLGSIMAGQMEQPFSLLLGRKTFEIFAGYWPDHEKEWPGINEMTKYVVSETIATHPWKNSVFISGDRVGEIRKLKDEDGPDMQVHGSSELIQMLLREDLVDELWLKIFPVTIGQGKRLFGNGTIPAAFKLIDSKVTPTGVIVANYRRAGDLETGTIGS